MANFQIGSILLFLLALFPFLGGCEPEDIETEMLEEEPLEPTTVVHVPWLPLAEVLVAPVEHRSKLREIPGCLAMTPDSSEFEVPMPTTYGNVDVFHYPARSETGEPQAHRVEVACSTSFCPEQRQTSVLVGVIEFPMGDPECSFLYRLLPEDAVEAEIKVVGNGRLLFDADELQEALACSTGSCTRTLRIGVGLPVQFEPVVGGEPPVFEPSESHSCDVEEVTATSALIVVGSRQARCTFRFPKDQGRRDILLDIGVGGVVEVDTASVALGVCDARQGSRTCAFRIATTDAVVLTAAASEALPRWEGDCRGNPQDPVQASIAPGDTDARCSFGLANPSGPDCLSALAPRIVVSRLGVELTLADGVLEIPAPNPAIVTLIADVEVVPPASYHWREEVSGVWRNLGDGEVLEDQLLSCEQLQYCALELTVEDGCGLRTSTLRYLVVSDR